MIEIYLPLRTTLPIKYYIISKYIYFINISINIKIKMTIHNVFLNQNDIIPILIKF